MTSIQSRHMLRLVNEGDASPLRLSPARNTAAPAAVVRLVGERIRRENLSASWISPVDARWILAVRTSQALEGGRAAILRPEQRRRLTKLATSLGLRPFDTNLVIAIVQDGSRTGDGALSPGVVDRLLLVPKPDGTQLPAGGSRRVWGLLIAAAALGLMGSALLVSWLLG